MSEVPLHLFARTRTDPFRRSPAGCVSIHYSPSGTSNPGFASGERLPYRPRAPFSHLRRLSCAVHVPFAFFKAPSPFFRGACTGFFATDSGSGSLSRATASACGRRERVWEKERERESVCEREGGATSDCRGGVTPHVTPLASECGTRKTVKARFRQQSRSGSPWQATAAAQWSRDGHEVVTRWSSSGHAVVTR